MLLELDDTRLGRKRQARVSRRGRFAQAARVSDPLPFAGIDNPRGGRPVRVTSALGGPE